MIFYEMLVLLKPDITQEVYDQIKESVEHIINTNKAEIKTFDRWGKYLLAYPVQKLSYGIYSLVRFGVNDDCPKAEMFEKIRLLFLLKFNSVVMRHVFVKQGKSLTEHYFRPDLLTDIPRRDRSEFSGGHKSFRDRNREDSREGLDMGMDGDLAGIEE